MSDDANACTLPVVVLLGAWTLVVQPQTLVEMSSSRSLSRGHHRECRGFYSSVPPLLPLASASAVPSWPASIDPPP
jgi:hypothetical protein